jgi:PAS domain S-box-containing protein
MKSTHSAQTVRLAGTNCRDYAELYQYAAPAYFSIARGGHICHANLASARLLKTDPASLLGLKFEQFLAPQAQKRVQSMLDAIFDGAAQTALEVTLNEELAGIRVRITVTQDPVDDVCRVIVVDMDRPAARDAALQSALLIVDHIREGALVCDRDNRTLSVNPAFTTITGYLAEEAIGRTPFFLCAGLQPAEFYEQMSRTLSASGQWQGEVLSRSKSGVQFLVGLSINALTAPDGSHAGFISLFEDVTNDKLAEAALLDAHRNLDVRVVERTSSLMETNSALSQHIAERERAERDLRVAERFFHATIDSLPDHVLVLDEAGSVVHANKAWCDFSQHASAGFSYLSLCETDPRWLGNSGVEFAAGIRSVIWGMPLSFALEYEYQKQQQSPAQGGAELPAQEHRWFQGKVSRFVADGPLRVVVTQIDITKRKAMEHALQQSQHQLRQLAEHLETAKEDERKRISRDIHDELGQNLLALRIDISMLGARTAHSHPHLHQRVNVVLGNIDATIKSVRGIMNELRPLVLDLGLHAALEWQIKDFSKRSNIGCVLLVPDDAVFGAIDSKVDIVLFRIMQEALTNILRHAKATWTEISLQEQAGQLLLTIRDDGIGMTQQQSRSNRGFGLIGIAERIAALGGDFDFGSASDGQGCELVVRIPLSD